MKGENIDEIKTNEDTKEEEDFLNVGAFFLYFLK